LFAIPLFVLVPAALVWNRRLLIALAIAAAIVLGPILGFRWNAFGSSDGGTLRILTLNVNLFAVELDTLMNMIEREDPDVIALQEAFGRAPIEFPRGWYVLHRDELILASRYPILETEYILRRTVPGKVSAIRYLIQLPDRKLQFFNLHLPTPRYGLEAVL